VASTKKICNQKVSLAVILLTNPQNNIRVKMPRLLTLPGTYVILYLLIQSHHVKYISESIYSTFTTSLPWDPLVRVS
jgi:hypothetical protein